MIIEQLITSFIASAAFVVIFNGQKRDLIRSGFVGMVGWIVYFLMVESEVDAVRATLAASIFVSVISQLFAKWFKTPIIIFNVAGIIPLVPGGMAYDAMRNLVENDYTKAVSIAANATLISGAIALGLIFSEVVNQLIRKTKRAPKIQTK